MAGLERVRVRQWQRRLAGRRVRTADGEGTLCDYRTDGGGTVSAVLVAFAPDDRRLYPAGAVELIAAT